MNPARRLLIDGQCPSVGVGCQFFESEVVQRLTISILDFAQLFASQELHGEAVNIRTAGEVMRPEQRVELKAQQRGSRMDVVRVYRINKSIEHPVTALNHRRYNQVRQVQIAVSSHQGLRGEIQVGDAQLVQDSPWCREPGISIH